MHGRAEEGGTAHDLGAAEWMMAVESPRGMGDNRGHYGPMVRLPSAVATEWEFPFTCTMWVRRARLRTN